MRRRAIEAERDPEPRAVKIPRALEEEQGGPRFNRGRDGLLLAYMERERHCNVPHKHKEQGAKLGMASWIN